MSEVFSLVGFIMIVCATIWFWAMHKDEMIRDAQFDQHFEDVQEILTPEGDR